MKTVTKILLFGGLLAAAVLIAKKVKKHRLQSQVEERTAYPKTLKK